MVSSVYNQITDMKNATSQAEAADKAKNGIKAVGAISIFMAILLQAAKNFNPGSNAVKTLTTLTVMISLLAVALIGLSFIDQQRLLTTAGALGAVMLSLAAVIAATNKLKVGKGVIKTLATVTLVVAAMAGIVALLSHFTDPHGAIASAGALSLLLVACGAIVIAMSKFKVNDKVYIKSIKYPYAIYDIETVPDTTTVNDNKLKLLTSRQVELFLKCLKLHLTKFRWQNSLHFQQPF